MKTKNSNKSEFMNVVKLICTISVLVINFSISLYLGVQFLIFLDKFGTFDNLTQLEYKAYSILTLFVVGGIVNGLLTLLVQFIKNWYQTRMSSKLKTSAVLVMILLTTLTSCDSKSEALDARWDDLNNKIEMLNINGDETDEYLYLRDLLDSAKTDSALNVVEYQYELVVR